MVAKVVLTPNEKDTVFFFLEWSYKAVSFFFHSFPLSIYY